MLKLKNVSKFYYSNGIVTSGFSKVNLELNLGEFVAITGESGSGKSTLLNVISGLDSYEDGEMYINGEETSAYSNADFENYRRQYIANIYQSFNLINSYTVYQNVEMVLLLARMKKSEIREKVNTVLKQVDLYKFRNTKASRLSGGQKQRVAIARALVKDTPIIVADEPTGNLDSESAANVIKLLSQLASDRLVIVVTHNYDQVEPYVTRKITMHDGRITEDLRFGKSREVAEVTEKAETSAEHKEIDYTAEDSDGSKKMHLGFFSRIRLGMRNAFNVVPKFILMLFVFLFICAAVTSFYGNMRSQDYSTETSGYNYYFTDTNDRRIVIKKTDGSAITDEDFALLEAVYGVDYVYRDDVMLDSSIYIADAEYNYYFSCDRGELKSLEDLDVTQDLLSYGHIPQSPDEIVLIIPSYSYLNNDESAADVLGSEFTIYDDYGTALSGSTIRIGGIYFSDTDDWKYTFYVSDEILENIRMGVNSNHSTATITAAGTEMSVDRWSNYNKPVPSDKVQPGCALVSEDWNYLFKKGKAKGQKLTLTVENLYYTDSAEFKISGTYTKKNFTEKTGYGDSDYYYGIVLVNSDDYYSLFDKDSYQSSVFIETPADSERVLKKLGDMGYTCLYVKDAIRSYNPIWDVVDKIFNNLWSGVLVVVLFFISYFIIKLIMKSRNVYYATVRMLGGSSGDCRSLIIFELLTVLNLAFVLSLAALAAAHMGYYSTELTTMILTYMNFKDYVVLYIVLALMSLVIALRYSRQLFKKTAMNVYKEV